MALSAEVRLPHILGSHMVLQRDMPIHVWGWSDVGEKVTVSLDGASGTASGDGLGQWSVFLPPKHAGGPFQLTVAGTNNIVLDDVLIGDVWFASGQSNMEMPLKGWSGAPLNNSADEISHANQPNMRLLVIKQKASDYPLRDIDGEWTPCTPETAAGFSAIAYFFGREISSREKVPVGLIDSSWGGTVAEAWVSLDTISSDAGLMPVFATRARMMDEQADAAAIVAKEHREDEAARAAGQPLKDHAWHPPYQSWAPAALYNGMVAPAVNYPIKGVIWYQGESNSRRGFPSMYQKIFPALIADWRLRWREGNFPFFYVQIANYKSNATENWAIIRESQRRTLAVAHTGMAVTIDIGNPDNVHPADKQTAAARLALVARALAYGENVQFSGPAFRGTSVEDNAVRVWFNALAGGLEARGGALTGFEIAGDDRRYVPAEARIDGQTVIVSSGQVSAPKYVRYGWANAPVVNLYNSAGLPASPFTSEEAIPDE